MDIAKQYFKPVPKEIVDKLIEKGDIMYCAGGFMIDDPLIHPYLDRREGTEDSIIGMPLALLKRLIDEVSLYFKFLSIGPSCTRSLSQDSPSLCPF